MPAAIDIRGKRYGKLVAISVTRTLRGERGWICQCDCGQQTLVRTEDLRNRNTTSCGCKQTEIIDRVGKVYGNLTVIREDTSRTSSDQAQWICRCICGNEVSKRGGDLTYSARGRGARDCGCLWKPHKGDAKRLISGLAAMRQILRRSKVNALERGYAWNLSEEQAHTLMQQACRYCGAPPQNICRLTELYGSYVYNGIDRVDNSKGYEPENVVPCCKFCNYAKHDRSVDEFLAWALKLYQHSIA
jgi:hypothetical protein